MPERAMTVPEAVALAVEQRRRGDLTEAESILRQVVAHAPGDQSALYELAEVLVALGNTDAAIDMFRRSAALTAGRETVAAGSEPRFDPIRLRDALVTAANEVLAGLGRQGDPLSFHDLVQIPRIWKYRMLSDCERVTGWPIISEPVVMKGDGEIRFGRDVRFGWPDAAQHYSGYAYVEVRTPKATIEIGDETMFNNGAMLCSEGAGIRIGANALFGTNVEIVDSDFHDLHPARRRGGAPAKAPVEIGENVFAGSNVKIMKGVTVGADTVIGNGAVVSKDLPAGVIAAGSPARVLRALDDLE